MILRKRPFLVLYLIPPELWDFPLWPLGTGIIPGPVWASDTIFLNALEWFFPSPEFPPTCLLISGILFPFRISHVWYSVLPILAALSFPDGLFTSERLGTSSYVLFYVLKSRNFLKEINWDSCKDHFICFLSIRDCRLHCLMSNTLRVVVSLPSF